MEVISVEACRTVSLAVLAFVGVTTSVQYGDRVPFVPFGVMLDHTAVSAQAAMEYKLYRHNDHDHKGHIKGRIMLHSVDSRKFINMRDVFSTNTEFCNLVREGVFAVFGTHTSETIHALQAFTSVLHMPFISPRMAVNMSGQELGYTLFMNPYYPLAIVDVVAHYGWKEVWYMLDSNDGLVRLQQIFDALDKVKYVLKVNVLRVKNAESGWEALMAVDKLRDENKHVILDMPLNESEVILKKEASQARKVRHHFFVIELGINEIELRSFDFGGMNVTGFRMTSDKRVRDFVNDWRKKQRKTFDMAQGKLTHDAALSVDGITVLARALRSLKQSNPAIFKTTVKYGKYVNNGTEQLNCDEDSELPWKVGYDLMKTIRKTTFADRLTGRISFDKYGLRTGYKMDILEVSNSRALSHIATWTDGKGLEMRSPDLVRPKPIGVQENGTRIVTSIATEPFLMLKGDHDKFEGNDKFEGYCADLVRKIQMRIKKELRIQVVKDGNYGARDDNGTWNGMVGELIRSEADLAIAPLTITADRERYIDFSKPFMSLGISIMIKKPTKESPGVFSFMYPLSYEIWMCVIFAYIGVSVVLFLVSRFSPFEWHIEDNTDGPSVTNNFTIFNSLWFSLGAFMQQGCDIEPRSMSGRIVGSVWWFFTLIIISSYTANLAAFLTVERMQSPIESAEDLAKQTEIKYGTVESGTTREFFKTSTIPVYERMWAFMSSAQETVFMKNNEEGIRKVRESNGRYAFLIESTANDYTNQREPCDTMKVGNNLDSKGYGIGTPLGSDLKDEVTLAVLELRESGELTKMETKWWYDKGKCGKESPDKKQETTNALKLSNVAGIFYILLGGLALALIMAALEFFYKSNNEAKRRKTSFTNAVRTKARLSIKGKPERQASAYTYTPAAQLITFDGYADANTHTQV